MKLRIPFTKISIPLELLIPAVASLFGMSQASAKASNEKNPCLLPTGSYTKSCTYIEIRPLLTLDPNIEKVCEVTAVCPTVYEGLPNINNNVLIPTNLKLQDVQNINGTLIHNGSRLPRRALALSQVSPTAAGCKPLSGSYDQTCTLDVQTYKSTDSELVNIDFCKQTTSCQTLNSASQKVTSVFFNQFQNNFKIENCDGTLRAGPQDDHCQNKSPAEIRSIADSIPQSSSLSL